MIPDCHICGKATSTFRPFYSLLEPGGKKFSGYSQFGVCSGCKEDMALHGVLAPEEFEEIVVMCSILGRPEPTLDNLILDFLPIDQAPPGIHPTVWKAMMSAEVVFPRPGSPPERE